MRPSALIFVCALVHVRGESWSILPKIMVVESHSGQHNLICLASAEKEMRRGAEEDILWQKNGEKQSHRGNVYPVWVEESTGGGNYTCHSKNGTYLNHTMVLIREQVAEPKIVETHETAEDSIKCTAPNYNGTFHCSWKWSSKRQGSLMLVRVHRASPQGGRVWCSSDPPGQQWLCSSAEGNIWCSADSSGKSITCLDKNHCPYAEEGQRISLTIYVRSNSFLLEGYNQHFFLSEIVKPDKVQISRVSRSVVELSYPSSWSKPLSYFPLSFEVKLLLSDCRKCDCTHSGFLPLNEVNSKEKYQLSLNNGVRAVCVRAKDPICDSKWSEWSLYRKRRRKNKDHLKRGQSSPII